MFERDQRYKNESAEILKKKFSLQRMMIQNKCHKEVVAKADQSLEKR